MIFSSSLVLGVTTEPANKHLPIASGDSPLITAIKYCHVEVVKYLLTVGAKPCQKGHSSGSVALCEAVRGVEEKKEKREKWMEIINLLLDVGADVHQRGPCEWSALELASMGDDEDLMTLLSHIRTE